MNQPLTAPPKRVLTAHRFRWAARRGRVVGLMRAIERADLERSNSPEEES